MSLDALADALGLGAARGAKALSRALGVFGAGLSVAALSDGIARALGQAGHRPVRASLSHGRLPLEEAAVDALCGSGFPATELLRECARVVRPGGAVLIATPIGIARRGPERHTVLAALLHAGLVDLEQHLASGCVISIGRVRGE